MRPRGGSGFSTPGYTKIAAVLLDRRVGFRTSFGAAGSTGVPTSGCRPYIRKPSPHLARLPTGPREGGGPTSRRTTPVVPRGSGCSPPWGVVVFTAVDSTAPLCPAAAQPGWPAPPRIDPPTHFALEGASSSCTLVLRVVVGWVVVVSGCGLAVVAVRLAITAFLVPRR